MAAHPSLARLDRAQARAWVRLPLLTCAMWLGGWVWWWASGPWAATVWWLASVAVSLWVAVEGWLILRRLHREDPPWPPEGG